MGEKGRLHVSPYHEGEPHKCSLCPANLCKGGVLEQLRQSFKPTRVIYVGDGGGDFCPSCDLQVGDYVLCRAPPSPPLTSFGLHRRIEKSRGRSNQLMTRFEKPAQVIAEVRYWHSGDDVAKIFCEF